MGARTHSDASSVETRRSVTAGVWAPPGFEQEPGSAFGFVYPALDEARRRDVAVLVAHAVDFTQTSGEPLVVFAKLGEHVGRLDVDRVVVHIRETSAGPVPRADGTTSSSQNEVLRRSTSQSASTLSLSTTSVTPGTAHAAADASSIARQEEALPVSVTVEPEVST